ncbi:MAG: TonB family protein [Cyclobacteriaceae bacterium]|nr:TonB family protein [Cyclobacteriaceae bacterium]
MTSLRNKIYPYTTRICRLIVLLCLAHPAFTQRDVSYDTAYLSKNFENVAPNQAVYYKVTNTIDNLEFPYVSITFLMNGTPFLVQHYDKKHVLHGFYQQFYPTAKVFVEGNYKHGKRFGLWKKYYPSGTLMEELEIVRPGFYPDGSDKYNVLSFFDSSGVMQVKDGTGWYTEYDMHLQPRHMGAYKQYQKIGNWIGYASDGAKYYEEKYVNGNLIKGTSYDDGGEAYTYKELILDAQPYGSYQSFYAFLNKHLKYPEDAKDFKIEGELYLSFKVKDNGSITDVNMLSGGPASLNDEARRVIKLAPAWKPCLFRGQPSAQNFVVPVTFSSF